MKKISEQTFNSWVKTKLNEKVQKRLAAQKMFSFESYLDDRGETPGHKDMVAFAKANTETIPYPVVDTMPTDGDSVATPVSTNIDVGVEGEDDDDDEETIVVVGEDSQQLTNLKKQELDAKQRDDALKAQVQAQQQRDKANAKLQQQAKKNQSEDLNIKIDGKDVKVDDPDNDETIKVNGRNVSESVLPVLVSAMQRRLPTVQLKFANGEETAIPGSDARILVTAYNALPGDLQQKFQNLLDKSKSAFNMAMQYVLHDAGVPVTEAKKWVIQLKNGNNGKTFTAAYDASLGNAEVIDKAKKDAMKANNGQGGWKLVSQTKHEVNESNLKEAVSTDPKDWKDDVAKLKAVADKVEARGPKQFPGEKDMISMYKGDADDLRMVADFISRGKFRDAYRKLANMDTAARDNCPTSTWNKLYKVTGNND
jgi:hypothetical protein